MDSGLERCGSEESIDIIILAAGHGKRLGLPTPKPLITVGGESMISLVVRAALTAVKDCGYRCISLVTVCSFATVDPIGQITGQMAEEFKFPSLSVTPVVQVQVDGTGSALRVGYDSLSSHAPSTLVLQADMPLITPETIASLLQPGVTPAAALSLAATTTQFPNQYGRVIIERATHGSSVRVVEDTDCTEEERRCNLVNIGVYLFGSRVLGEVLPALTCNNSRREYYLTQLITLIADSGNIVTVRRVTPIFQEEFINVNTAIHLAHARHARMVQGTGSA